MNNSSKNQQNLKDQITHLVLDHLDKPTETLMNDDSFGTTLSNGIDDKLNDITAQKSITVSDIINKLNTPDDTNSGKSIYYSIIANTLIYMTKDPNTDLKLLIDDIFDTTGFVTCFGITQNVCSGMYNKLNDELYIVIRGSLNTYDWINNFDARRKKIIVNSNSKSLNKDIYVHNGFYTIYNNILSDVREIVELFSKKKKINKIIYTGHSMGGAVATITAAHHYSNFSHLDNFKDIPIFLHTFGCPCVGNTEFYKYIDSINIAREHYVNTSMGSYTDIIGTTNTYDFVSPTTKALYTNYENNKIDYTIKNLITTINKKKDGNPIIAADKLYFANKNSYFKAIDNHSVLNYLRGFIQNEKLSESIGESIIISNLGKFINIIIFIPTYIFTWFYTK
jgi:Lipase (class 3)